LVPEMPASSTSFVKDDMWYGIQRLYYGFGWSFIALLWDRVPTLKTTVSPKSLRNL